MTGEISLRGRVLAIGGLKEKTLAAHRKGLRVVLLPEANRKDIEDIPRGIRDELDLRPVTHMDQVLKMTLDWPESDSRLSGLMKDQDLALSAQHSEDQEEPNDVVEEARLSDESKF